MNQPMTNLKKIGPAVCVLTLKYSLVICRYTLSTHLLDAIAVHAYIFLYVSVCIICILGIHMFYCIF